MTRTALFWTALGGAALLATAAAGQGDERLRLAEAQTQAREAAARAAQLERRATAERDLAARTRADAAALAGRVQSAEAEIAAMRARLVLIDRLRRAQRARLAERQQPAVRLVAALQSMTRRPPALALAQPGSLEDLVHVRAVMASMLPAIAERTEDLRAEVERGRPLRAEAERSLAALRATQRRLETQRLALAKLEALQRRRARALGAGALAEGDRALALGEQARDIGDLMASLQKQSRLSDVLAALPGPLPRPPIPGAVAAPPPDQAPRQQHRFGYSLPAVGRIVTGFGEVSDSGVRARGLTLATAPGAQVVAPAAGRIAYAGAYRGFGQIVIVEHSDGMTTLITNLAQLGTRVGASVDSGSPLGRAGRGQPRITVELRRNGTPVDIVPLLS